MDPNQIAKLMEDNFDKSDDDDEDLNDEVLENELEDLITGGGGGKAKPAPKSSSTTVATKIKNGGKLPLPKKQQQKLQKQPPPSGVDGDDEMATFDLNNIQNLLKTFDENEDDDDDEEIDENDPTLLSELTNVLNNPLPPPKKTRTPIKKPTVPQPVPSEPEPKPEPIQIKTANNDEEKEMNSTEQEENLNKIKNLQLDYKRAALKAKTNNDKITALAYLKVSKQLDGMLQSLQSGEKIDWNLLPPKPENYQIPTPEQQQQQQQQQAQSEQLDPQYEMNQDEAAKFFNAPKSAGSVMEALEQRLNKFKSTKEQAEAENNSNKARRLGRIIKQIETAIKDYKAGKPVNFDELPCPPGFPPIPVENKAAAAAAPPRPPPSVKVPAPTQQQPRRQAPMIPVKSSSDSPVVQPAASAAPAAQVPEGELDPEYEMNPDEAAKFFNAPTSAGSVMEALEQRLNKFKSTKEQALAENNANKARRLGRIVTQIEKAIKDYKAGKPVNFDELPCPPGFPPIPVENKSGAAAAPSPAQPAKRPAQPSAAGGGSRPPLKKQMSTSASKQLNYLLQRQKLFREAAIEAKKRGEIEQAKEYLRTAKGFDSLIEATKSGLPIDATSIPTPPQLSEDFLVTSKLKEFDNDSIPSSSGSLARGSGGVGGGFIDIERDELYDKIAQELKSQIEMCIRNREYFLKMGDIPTSSKFEKYATDSKKDLHMLLIRKQNGDPIPSYRVEERTFSIVVANLDVPLNELHVEVIRAFDFSGTPEIDTYVRADFPFPSENPQWKRTKTFHDSLNPEYNDTLFFQIDRKSRALPRILKRHPLKLTVYAKGCVLGKLSNCFKNINCLNSGFLRSDQPIGLVQIKLNDLETKCTIHECSSWTQGRKVIQGKLEVKIKIREPLLAKQIEEIKEKWIVFS